MEGWIKIHRKITEWQWWDKPEVVYLFLYFLLLANHADNEWHGIPIKRGQFITGLDSLSKSLGISTQTIRTCITRLKSTGEITNKSTNKYRLITIVKWEQYQCDDKKSTSKLTSYLTNNQQTTNKQLTANKNDNNDKNEKNTKTIVLDKVSFGQENINWLLNEFEQIMGFKSSGTKDRYLAKHLLNNFKREQLSYMLNYCATNEYAPRIGSVEKLWYKRGDIIAGIRSLKNNNKVIKI